MQKAYIRTISELMERDPNVMLLLADSGTEYDLLMVQQFPKQYVNTGIAEENLIGVAAGLAASGKIPFIYANGAFLAYRAYEFIRLDACLQELPVKLIGMGSGLSIGSLGPTHHTTEDVAVLSVLPKLTILSPATPNELSACIRKAYELSGPVYIRMEMGGEPELFTDERAFTFGKNRTVWPENGECTDAELTIYATGSILSEVLSAVRAERLSGRKIAVRNVSTIKPFDTEDIRATAANCRRLMTVEEHQIRGGLGGLMAETIAEYALPVRLWRVGLADSFATGYGTQEECRVKNGLSAAFLTEKIEEFLDEPLSF